MLFAYLVMNTNVPSRSAFCALWGAALAVVFLISVEVVRPNTAVAFADGAVEAFALSAHTMIAGVFSAQASSDFEGTEDRYVEHESVTVQGVTPYFWDDVLFDHENIYIEDSLILFESQGASGFSALAGFVP